jgi:hypothetical protein
MGDAQYESLEALAQKLDAISPEQFAGWTEISKSPSGDLVLPYPRYDALEEAWRAAVANFGGGDPSSVYDAILKGERSRPTLDAIKVANPEELKGFATFIIRGERFCDGHIAAAHKGGLLSSVLRRYLTLSDPSAS